MSVFRSGKLALALSLLAAPAAATGQSVVDIEIGQSRTGKAGSLVDLYRFGGASGTVMTARLTASGRSALILYSPAGEEMLSKPGQGTIELHAVLPLWDVFYLGVVRESASKPYTLTLSGDAPDNNQALFAHKVGFSEGYGGTCWDEPGKIRRRKTSTGDTVAQILPGRGYFTKYYDKAGQPIGAGFETTVTLVDTTITWSTTIGNPMRSTLTEVSEDPVGAYTGYLCAD